jgi:16S rRNA (guanine527-N7)-methyltransferase
VAARAAGEIALLAALAHSQRLGMLGARPVADVVAHSEAFVDALADVHDTVVDLGTGGGVPGLVIAWRRPDLHLVLVDRRETRADHVARLVRRLGLADRVTVVTAEATALPGQLGEPVGAVVARGFGPPRDVVRAAAPLLGVGGLLVVSEPTEQSARWDPSLMATAGLTRRSHPDRRVAVFARST